MRVPADDRFLACPGLGTTTCAKVSAVSAALLVRYKPQKKIVRLSSGVVYERGPTSVPRM